MAEGLLGRKVGMASVYRGGVQIPVTVIEVAPNAVVQAKSADGKDGYDALQLAAGKKSAKRVNKALTGHYEKVGVAPKLTLREFRGMGGREAGSEVRVEEVFAEGDVVHVRGKSKGRGFAGVMKRHGFHGHKASHGTHESKRGPGSIGAMQDPGRVWKGKRMAGHYGDKMITTKNLEVIEIIADQNLLLVRGSVPGARNAVIELHKAE
jgi:large subunit ribosomal protein L3